MKDFTGEEIEVGDIVIRASTQGRSPALEWAIVVSLRYSENDDTLWKRDVEKLGIISSGNERVGYTFPERVLVADDDWAKKEIVKELKEKQKKYNEQNRRKEW